jgi:hypothetical protein
MHRMLLGGGNEISSNSGVEFFEEFGFLNVVDTMKIPNAP